jgi:hypothetical protein
MQWVIEYIMCVCEREREGDERGREERERRESKRKQSKHLVCLWASQRIDSILGSAIEVVWKLADGNKKIRVEVLVCQLLHRQSPSVHSGYLGHCARSSACVGVGCEGKEISAIEGKILRSFRGDFGWDCVGWIPATEFRMSPAGSTAASRISGEGKRRAHPMSPAHSCRGGGGGSQPLKKGVAWPRGMKYNPCGDAYRESEEGKPAGPLRGARVLW